MKNIVTKVGLSFLSTLLLLFFSVSSDLFAGSLKPKFRHAIKTIEKIPYNPRPIATDTFDVTGISQKESIDLFLKTFSREEIAAPANGRTFKSSDPTNAPDITLVGYWAMQEGEDAITRPWIIVTHGGTGKGSIATHGEFLVHIANVLFANGYNVLALDRRDGLLSRCAYDVYLNPDPDKSQAAYFYTPSILYCDFLPMEFRKAQLEAGFEANSLVSDFQAFSPGDVLAAAQFLKDEKGARKIGALGGSMGGINIIRAAFIQDEPDNDFDSGLLDVLLAFSPVGDFNTIQYVKRIYEFQCFTADAGEFYSTIPGTGLGDFSTDPVGVLEDFYGLLNGVKIIQKVKIPVLIIYTLTEHDCYPTEGLAYKAKTDKMKLGHTIIMSLLGHFHETWRSDPFWGDKMVLTYFKRLLARKSPGIGEDPGFSSLGPNTDNPFIIDLKIKRKDADKFLSQESIVQFLAGWCF